MTKRDLVLIACRMMAIVSFLVTLPDLSRLVFQLKGIIEAFNKFPIQTAMFYLHPIIIVTIYLNISLLLWFGASRFLFWLIDNPSTADQQCNFPAKDLCTVLVAVLGLYFICTQIAGFAKTFQFLSVFVQNREQRLQQFLLYNFPYYLMGLLLIFGCKTISGWIFRKEAKHSDLQ